MEASFVVVGESLVDFVVPADGGPRHSAVGGSPLNVAVGLARLDVPTTLLTRVGDDDLGKLVVDHVSASDVRLADGSVVPGGRTSTSTAHLDSDQAATYEFDLVWDLPAQELPVGTMGLHVGSIGAIIPPGSKSVLELVRRAVGDEVFVSYDPNMRPVLLDDPATAWADVLETARNARLVKLSDEDLRFLRPGVAEEDVCRELLAGGTELVVLTRGAQDATAFTEGATITADVPATDVADTVGAGDSFMAAMLAMLCEWAVVTDGEGALRALDDDRVRMLVRGAATAAALTCSRRGADPPTRSELPPTWPAG